MDNRDFLFESAENRLTDNQLSLNLCWPPQNTAQ